MTTPAEPTRRYTLALTAAVAATTVAIGVTAATLFGWFRPAEPVAAPPEPPVVYAPTAPTIEAAPVAVDERRHHDHDDHDDHEDDDD